MDRLLLLWALIASYYAYKNYKAAVLNSFVSNCLLATGILAAGSEKYGRTYSKVLRNQSDTYLQPVYKVYKNLHKEYGLPNTKYGYEDLESIERVLLKRFKSLEPELLKQSKSYE